MGASWIPRPTRGGISNVSLMEMEFCEVVGFLESYFQLERRVAFNKVFEIHIYRSLFDSQFLGYNQKNLFQILAKVKRNGVDGYKINWQLDSIALQINFGQTDIDLELIISQELMHENFEINFSKKTKTCKNKTGNVLNKLALATNNRITDYFGQRRPKVGTKSKRKMVRHNSENNLSIIEDEKDDIQSDTTKTLAAVRSTDNPIKSGPEVPKINANTSLNVTSWLQFDFEEFSRLSISRISVSRLSSTLDDSCHILDPENLSDAFDSQKFKLGHSTQNSQKSFSPRRNSFSRSRRNSLLDFTGISSTSTCFTPLKNKPKRKSIFQSSPMQEMISSTPTSKMNLYKSALNKVAQDSPVIAFNNKENENNYQNKGSIILLDSISSEEEQILPEIFKKSEKRARMSTSILLIEDDSIS